MQVTKRSEERYHPSFRRKARRGATPCKPAGEARGVPRYLPILHEVYRKNLRQTSSGKIPDILVMRNQINKEIDINAERKNVRSQKRYAEKK